jgi:hypothetical protein
MFILSLSQFCFMKSDPWSSSWQVHTVRPSTHSPHFQCWLRWVCQHHGDGSQCFLPCSRRHRPVQRASTELTAIQIMPQGTVAANRLWSGHWRCMTPWTLRPPAPPSSLVEPAHHSILHAALPVLSHAVMCAWSIFCSWLICLLAWIGTKDWRKV